MTDAWLSDEELRERKQWEQLSPNAGGQPDKEVLAMIAELQERRELLSEKGSK